eukprot:CAMPEP_0171090070 /NCGR_PEP_ID=MMETSP0766_2-20121228/28717_1 /TAXON_ID=439317 /ORGANISM="Gambierdiscus australes, Strain CAWD 149" /LENGTH=51 /DNA_ID=CAMNT_0011548021 /DNA_START=95 /DNA_END=154 /DNA_ORIENTATION=+
MTLMDRMLSVLSMMLRTCSMVKFGMMAARVSGTAQPLAPSPLPQQCNLELE